MDGQEDGRRDASEERAGRRKIDCVSGGAFFPFPRPLFTAIGKTALGKKGGKITCNLQGCRRVALR